MYRIKDLICTAQKWQESVALTSNSDSDLNHTCGVGWSDVAYAVQSKDRKCLMGYKPRQLPPILDGFGYLIHWSSRFTRRNVKSSLVLRL